MSGLPPHEQLRELETVRQAARLSLAANGVRVCRARVRESDDGWTEPWGWSVGVAVPAERSVHWHHFVADHSPWMKLADAAQQRWPWLSDDQPSEPDPKGGYETIEIGRNHYGGGPGGWSDMDWNDGPFYGPGTGLWPLEALLGTTRVTRCADFEVRGERCARYVCEVLPGDVADLDDIRLVDPPKPDDDWRALSADVCIDSAGRVRRIAWSPVIGRRHRPGLFERLAMTLNRKPTPKHAITDLGRLWTVTDFWDYGCHTEISAPTKLRDLGETSRFAIARDLWRMRRDYKKRHRQTPTGSHTE